MRKASYAGLLIVLAALVACCGGTSHVNAPDGKDALEVKCKSDRADCLSEAGSACGTSGYYVMSEDSHSGGWAADLIPGPVPWWTMTVRCGIAPTGYEPPPAAAASVTPLPPIQASSPQAAPNTTYAPNTIAQQASAECSSDFSCPMGQKRVKDSYAFHGVCAQPVNQYGAANYSPPSGNSIGPGQGQCQFATQCPIGFQCVKTSGGLYGNCMK